MEPPQNMEVLVHFCFLAISFAGKIIYPRIIEVDDHPLDLGMVGLDHLHLSSFEGVAGVRDTLFRGEFLVAGFSKPVRWLHSPHHGRNHNPRNPN